MTETTHFSWDEIAPLGDDRVDRRLIAGAAGDLKRVAVPAGTVASRHTHDFEQFFMVVEGTGILTHAGGEIALKPGMVVHFAPDAWHSAVFHTDTVLVEVNFRQT
jgi:quercetin dioxygenase-like cupin family protein